MLRMNNLQANGWDLSDIKYVELTDKELANWKLESGDIVFNRTNSKELVGKCEVFREPGTWVFASYLMRLQVSEDEVIPEFLSAILNGPTGRAQIDRESRQIIGMSNINAEEIRTLRVPLPPIAKQRAILKVLNAKRSMRDEKLTQAENRIVDLDQFVLDELGLVLPPARDPSKPFAVRLSALRGSRLDPPAYAPLPLAANSKDIPILRLDEVAQVNGRTGPSQTAEDAVVPYVGLPECSLTEVREVATRTYNEVRGRSVAFVGDILFARIEPSVFNKKYVLVDHLCGHDYAFLSTEFYSVRVLGTDEDQRYLYAMLHSAFVYDQVRGKTTGSSGRRRIDIDLFKSLLVPWPDASTRKKVAAEVARRREEALRLRSEAKEVWEMARDGLENEVLRPTEHQP